MKLSLVLKKIKNKLRNTERLTSDNKHYLLFPDVEIVNCEIGKYTYIAKNSIVHNAVIGNFVSIGPNVVIGYGDHPTDFMSTSPVFYEKEFPLGFSKDQSSYFGKQKVTIGADVWIGANAFIKNGVEIGFGAIIGAGAVVLKDVAPYSIVVGVPAKHLRFRFNDDLITKLLETKWWEWSEEKLKENQSIIGSSNFEKSLDE